MLPISQDVELSGKIALVKGELRFRIVGYFGNPAALGHGKRVSNISFPNEVESLYVNITGDYKLPRLRLLKRDYVCEFAVMDESNAKPFEVRFTATGKRREPWLREAEGVKDLGRLMIAVGIPLVVVGITNLLQASG